MKVSKKQKNKFIETARAAGCSEDEAEFDRNLKRIAKLKASGSKKMSKKRTNSSDD